MKMGEGGGGEGSGGDKDGGCVKSLKKGYRRGGVKKLITDVT